MTGFGHMSAADWLQVRQARRMIIRYGAMTDGVVLDLGCGHSPWRDAFPNAREFLRMDRYPVDDEVIVIDDILALPLENGRVDAVILSRMLGDITDQPRFMHELSRILAPGGRLLIYESISYPQHDLPHDYWRVLPGGLKWTAAQAGLEIEELVYCGGLATQIATPVNTLLIRDLGGLALTRPIAAILRGSVNLMGLGLDRLIPRPELATDYFASVIKTQE